MHWLAIFCSAVLGRVNYDIDNWFQIQRSLLNGDNYAGIDVLTRAHLISDMFALAEIGEISYEFVFDTTKYLKREEHYSVWKVAAIAFEKIWFLLRGTKSLELFEVKYIQQKTLRLSYILVFKIFFAKSSISLP